MPHAFDKHVRGLRKRAIATGSGAPWQGPESGVLPSKIAPKQASRGPQFSLVNPDVQLHIGARGSAKGGISRNYFWISGFIAEPVIGPANRPDPLAMPRNDEKMRCCAIPSDVQLHIGK